MRAARAPVQSAADVVCFFGISFSRFFNRRGRGGFRRGTQRENPQNPQRDPLLFSAVKSSVLDFNCAFTLKPTVMARKTKLFKPTKQQLIDAAGKTLPDVIARNLRVLFCGINPGLYTAAIGHHFARPGNRFWPALHKSGFTDRLLSPFDERELVKAGLGITNVVAYATASASELTKEDFIE